MFILTVDWVVGDVALDRDTRGQVAAGPRAVSLADARGPAHHLHTWHGLGWAGGVADLEARLAAVGHLAAVGGAAVLGRGQPVQDLLGPPAVWTRGR